MILFYLFIILLALYGIRFTSGFHNDPKEGFLSKPSTDAIKGIFILVVFSRHIYPYITSVIPDPSYLDRLFGSADAFVRQLLVVMFLFYSGYGVAESIRLKGEAYVRTIPVKRVLITLVNFAIAVCFFIALALIIGKDLTVSQCLLSLTGWESVGNSNWYIFCILVMYAVTYVAFTLFNSNRNILTSLTILTLVYIFVVQRYRGGYWVDTAFAYPAGVAFSMYKDKAISTIQKRYWLWLGIFAICFGIFYVLPYRNYMISCNICAIFFALLVVTITMKVRIRNRYLCWFGKNLFPLYIYQRIPMIALAAVGEGYLIVEHEWLYVVASLLITIAIAYGYKYIQVKSILSKTSYKETAKIQVF